MSPYMNFSSSGDDHYYGMMIMITAVITIKKTNNNNKKFWEELIAYLPSYDTGHIENDASNNLPR
jgi:hypothetical protein